MEYKINERFYGPYRVYIEDSYMSAHVLLNLLNKLGKRAFDLFFATSLINSIIQLQEC